MSKKAEQLKKEKEKAREQKQQESQQAEAVVQNTHWLKRSLSKRQKRTAVLIVIFVILALISSIMYYRTGGEYNETTDIVVETILGK